MFGTQQPGSYDRAMPMSPLGKKAQRLKSFGIHAAATGLAPIVQVAENLLKNTNLNAFINAKS